MNGRGRAGEIVNLIYFNVEREGHVMPDEFKARMRKQVLDVRARSAEEVIDAYDVRAAFEQAFTEVGAEKT